MSNDYLESITNFHFCIAMEKGGFDANQNRIGGKEYPKPQSTYLPVKSNICHS